MKRSIFAVLFVVLVTNLASTVVEAWSPTSPDAITAISLGSIGYDVGSDIDVDSSGNFYVAGIFDGTMDVDPGPGTTNLTANGFGTIFVTKYSSTGSLIWAKSMGNAVGDKPVALSVNSAQEVFLAGGLSQVADFDPGPGTNILTPNSQSQDIFVVKLTPAGDLDWGKAIGGPDFEQLRDLSIDSASNVYVVGRYQGTIDFDPSPATSPSTTLGGDDAYVVKLDTTGAFVWGKGFGGQFSDTASGVSVDPQGNVYVAGSYSSTADFDPSGAVANLTVVGQFDAFLLKLDSSGNYVWAKSFGGSRGEEYFSVATDADGNIVLVGGFRGSGDFDPDGGSKILTSAGDLDVAVLKLTSSGNLSWAGSFGGTDWDDIWGLDIDSVGEIYVTGTFGGSGDFDPTSGVSTLSVSGYGVYIVNLSSSGTFDWAKAVGGASYDVGNAIAVDSAGNSLIVGYFSGSSDFNPGSGTATLNSNQGTVDAFALRLSTAGDAALDITAPTATLQGPTSPSSSRTLTYTATFSEPVSGISANDFTITGTAAGCVASPSASSTSASLTVSVTCTSDGSVILQINANSLTDSSSNNGPTSAIVATSITIATTNSNTTATTTTTSTTTVPSQNVSETDAKLPTTGTATHQVLLLALLTTIIGFMIYRATTTRTLKE